MRWAVVCSSLAVAALLAVAAAGRARACSCVQADPRFERPRGALPADARALVLGGNRWAVKKTRQDVGWDPMPTASRFRIQRVDGGRAESPPVRVVPFPETAIWDARDIETLGLLITTEGPLAPGGVYRFSSGE